MITSPIAEFFPQMFTHGCSSTRNDVPRSEATRIYSFRPPMFQTNAQKQKDAAREINQYSLLFLLKVDFLKGSV